MLERLKKGWIKLLSRGEVPLAYDDRDALTREQSYSLQFTRLPFSCLDKASAIR